MTRKSLRKKDVINISVDTTKEDELFDYVGYERYYGVPKYNELDDDYEKCKGWYTVINDMIVNKYEILIKIEKIVL